MADRNIREPRIWVAGLILLMLAAIPLASMVLDQPYFLKLFSRIMIYALAAAGLNLILGYTGMASLGHALYVGIGAYGVGMLEYHGIVNGWLQLCAALVVGGLFALAVGAVVVRLNGMTFIMITLAFAQMGYFLMVTLRTYGGEDGRTIAVRSDMGLFTLSNATVLYVVIFTCLVATLGLLSRMVNSPFGMVLRGCRSNERRVLALGIPTYRYKLVAYVISSLLCVVAGFLLANLTQYASPSFMQWTVSAELIIMVILGGKSTVFGPVVGALAFLLLEEWLSEFSSSMLPEFGAMIKDHWLAVVGAFVIAVVLMAKNGIYGHIYDRSRRNG